MKGICKMVAVFFVLLLSGGIQSSQAFDWGDIFNSGKPSIPYCEKDGDCGWEEGIEHLENIEDVVTDQTASEYIQNVVVYLISFLTLIAVLYIIYAGFNILIGNGDEEKMKKSKGTITYVIIGLVIIFLAWSIVRFVLDVLDRSGDSTGETAYVQY